jgi:cytosine/adenosine deaminase-related metal-dependent hydrolase
MTTLLRHAKILVSARADCLVGADLLLRDDRIAEIGSGLAADHVGDRVGEIDARGNVVMPGLIQTHVHLCQTPLLGSAGDVKLMDWLTRRAWPLEAAHDPETLYHSVRWGALKLIRSGTTAIIDHETIRHTEAAFQGLLNSGLRAQSGKVLMDHEGHCPPYLRESTEEALRETLALIARYHKTDEGPLTYGLNPRFVVSCTDRLLREVGKLARRMDVPIHVHAHEEPVSLGIVERERGKRPIPHLHDLGLLGPKTQLVHCVHLTDGERKLLADTGTHVCHCPSSNLVLGSGIAPVPELRDAGVNVSLGSDATAFNPTLSAWSEMRDAALIQAQRLGPTALTARDVLEMATVNGAKALGMEDALGTLEVGRKADLIIVEVEPSPYAESEADGLIHSMVYDPASVRVRTNIVNGRVLMQDGEVRTLDAEQVEAKGREALAELIKRIDAEGRSHT